MLKGVVASESPYLVILGKQSIDGDNNQNGQMLAALAGMGQGTFAVEVNIGEGTVQVTREVDGGLQTGEMKHTAVVTHDLRPNAPRYASVPNLMKAKKNPIENLSTADLGGESQSHVALVGVKPPAERSAGIKVESVEQLVDKLKNAAKVIS